MANVRNTDFDNEASWTSAAQEAFREWARTTDAPTNVDAFIKALRRADEHVAVLTTQYTRRRILWQCYPYEGREPPGQPPVSPSDYDAWTVDEEQLRPESEHIFACGQCDGMKDCTRCIATGYVRCDQCEGSGKSYDTDDGDERPCETCNGNGRLKCPDCVDGRRKCELYSEKTVVRRWLKVHVDHGQDVKMTGDPQLLSSWHDAETFEKLLVSREQGFAARRDTSFRARVEIPSPSLPTGARIAKLSLDVHTLPVVLVDYAVGKESATIPLVGRSLEAPKGNTDALFAKQKRRYRLIAALLATIPVLTLLYYLSRGPYFLSWATAGIFLGVSVTCAGVLAKIRSMLVRPSNSRRWAASIGLGLATTVALAIAAEPSVEKVRELIARGDIAKAEYALQALGPTSSSELAPYWRALAVEKAMAAGDRDALLALAQTLPSGSPTLAKLQRKADALGIDAIADAATDGRIDDVERLLPTLGPEARDNNDVKRARVLLFSDRARECIAREDWDCTSSSISTLRAIGDAAAAATLDSERNAAFKSFAEKEARAALDEQDPARRVERLARAMQLWKEWSRMAQEPLPQGLADKLTKTLAEDRQLLEAERERARREEEKRQRRHERRRKREESKREQSERPSGESPTPPSD